MIDSTLWYLYGNDLELAQLKLNLAILKRETKHEKLRFINLLTYVGDYESCSDWLTKIEGNSEIAGQQSQYRILRHNGTHNPWQALIGSQSQRSLDITLSKHIEQGNNVSVDLVGGIGDQIENAAILLASKKNLKNPETLLIRPTGENSTIVREFLKLVPNSNLESEKGEKNSWHVTAPWFRFWLGLNSAEAPPQRLTKDITPPLNAAKVLVCWRSKIDTNNPLSSFSRSLPFKSIMKNYEELKKELAEKHLEIYDTSSYTREEACIIQANNQSVRLVREEINNLDDTRHFMSKCPLIISVDTSLVHLATACGRDVDLLLNQFPDERWQDLRQTGSSYEQHVTVYQQENFHDWEKPLKTLRNKMVKMAQKKIITF